jgi:hypothetical protein
MKFRRKYMPRRYNCVADQLRNLRQRFVDESISISAEFKALPTAPA